MKINFLIIILIIFLKKIDLKFLKTLFFTIFNGNINLMTFVFKIYIYPN